MQLRIVYLLLCFFIFSTSTYAHITDPLPSWNNGLIKKNLTHFVETVTDSRNKAYVPPSERIATIDNDGTLWLEQPVYTQVVFMLNRYVELAKTHPAWQQSPLFKKITHHQIQSLSKQELENVFATTSTDLPVEDYQRIVKIWLAVAKNPRFKHRYTELVYQPMLEVLHYLRAHQFTIYIVSGGGQDFIRAFSQPVYEVTPEHVLGTATKSEYTQQQGKPALIKKPQILFICDKAGKVAAINLLIGKKPIIAFGNSDGDREMLEWTQSNQSPSLMLLVHHDDAIREYAYDTESKVGTFSQSLMAEANQRHWQIISMKKDWKIIFPFEKK